MEKDIIELKDPVDDSKKEELELRVKDVQLPEKNLKILSVAEVTDFEDKSQFKDEITKEYANMIKKDIKIANYDSFVQFLKQGLIYVDKSLFIEHVLENMNNLVITCPRRWGKSLNLSMLKAFLQPDGEDKTHHDENNMYDFNFGNKNQKLFEALKIANVKDGHYMKEYQGQYPVIYLKLGDVSSIIIGDAKEDKDEIPDLEKKLRAAISKSYMEHQYLEEWIQTNYSKNKKIEYANKFEAYTLKDIKYSNHRGDEKIADINESLEFLRDLLYEYYGRRVFILIDEFDKPVITFQSEGNNIQDNIKGAKLIAKKVSNIIKPCSKDNDYIFQIIVTGIQNSLVLDESSKLNSFKEEGVLAGELAQYFGFLDNEVNSVLDEVFKFKNNTHYKKLLFDKLKEWYNGQIIGETEVFTPYSIMNYLEGLLKLSKNPLNTVPIFDEYWPTTETNKILKFFIELMINNGYKKLFLKLTNISINIPVIFTFQKNIKLIDIFERFSPKNEVSESDLEELCFYHLSRSGYITKIKGERNKFKMPAKEIEIIYKKDIVPAWKKELFIDEVNKDKFMTIVKDIDFFCYDKSDVDKKMNKAFKLVTPKYSTMKEEVFRIVLHQAIENSSVESKFIDVEFNSGLGRADLVFYYDSVVNLFELKFVDCKQPENKLEEALKQIYEKNYMEGILELLKKEKYQELKVKIIKLIPIIIFRVTNNTEWQYKTGTIQKHTIDDAEKIVEKMNELTEYNSQHLLIDHLVAGNNYESFAKNKLESNVDRDLLELDNSKNSNIKISLDELIAKINKSNYYLKDTIIERLEKDNKKNYTKKEALKAINIKTKKALGNILIEDIFKNNPIKKSKKKKGLIDELSLKTSNNLTYYSGELNWILKHRILEEQLSDKVIQLDTHKSYEYNNIRENISNLLRRVKEKLLHPEDTVLVPYAEEEHFIGLVIKISKEGIPTINYLDSENMEIEEDLKEELLNRNVKINIIPTIKQLYEDNCGIETIENLIAYLRDEDLLNRKISQEEAILKHTKLIKLKNSNNTNEEDLKIKEIMELFKKLEIKAHKKRPLKEFISLNETKEMPYILLKKKLREEYSSMN